MLKKNHQNSLFNRCSSSQQSQPSQHRYWEAPEIYRLKSRAYKDVETECSLYSTICMILNMYYPK
jgi:hypothetical protein